MAEGRQAAWLRIDSIDAAGSKARSPRPFDAGLAADLAAEAIAGFSRGQIELRSSTRGARIKTAVSFGETPQTESLGRPFRVDRPRSRSLEVGSVDRSEATTRRGIKPPSGGKRTRTPAGRFPRRAPWAHQ